MRLHKYSIIALFFASVLQSCSPILPSPTETPDLEQIETIIAATLTANIPPTSLPTQIPAAQETLTALPLPTTTFTPVATPTPMITSISGKVCYRSRDIPEMTAYFENTEDHSVTEVPIQAGQITYTVELEPGTYLAYAWLADFSLGGLYSHAVPCGLTAGCTDRSPLPFDLNSGDRLEGIDLCDWYAFSVPRPPGKPLEEITGAIAGSIAFPDGSPPSLHVVAFNRKSDYWYYTVTNPGAGSYLIDKLPPGDYNILAYTAEGRTGAHADSSSNLVIVQVQAGETTRAANIDHWDAPAGSFPADPTTW